ncbi:DUF4399 domain-containing protein [Oceanisphaera sp. KMM 10153]|uniref:DUF4399 domain-containing protein n=1 Tax=Oceanisphaera submarina TaxID=3390193 RepID=UPI003975B9FB
MMRVTNMLGAAALVAALSVSATPAPEGARVYFLSPADGEVLGSEFTVRFGLEGMGVAPAGVEKENTGHHHLLINADPMPDLSQPLPASDQVHHFGGGQTETRLILPPGDYRLQLVLGDAQHVPHQPPVMSDVIQITVK